MIEIKNLLKVIVNKNVYYKLNDIVKVKELKGKYKQYEAKEILKPYATKIKGLGAELWIAESDLEKVRIISKTLSYEVVKEIKDNVSAGMFALQMVTIGKEEQLKEFIEKEKSEIIDKAIDEQAGKEDKMIDNIEKVIADIKHIDEINEGISKYSKDAKIVYEIKDKYEGYKIDAMFVAPNMLRNIYCFNGFNELIYADGDINAQSFKDCNDCECNLKPDILYFSGDDEPFQEVPREGKMLWDTSKGFFENGMNIINNETVITANEGEYIDADSKDDNGMKIHLTIETADLVDVVTNKHIVRYTVQDLLYIKEQLLINKIENVETVKKLKK